MAPDLPVIHDAVSRTHKGVIQRYNTLFQTGGSRNNLKCRSRFISIVNAPVPPHLIELVLKFFIRQGSLIYSCIQLIGIVQIKFRDIDHGIDFAVLRIHQKDRYRFRLLFFHHILCRLLTVCLHIIVKTYLKSLPGYRFDSVLCHAVELNAPGIRHCQYRSIGAFQIVLILYFQTDDSLIIPSGKSKHP